MRRKAARIPGRFRSDALERSGRFASSTSTSPRRISGFDGAERLLLPRQRHARRRPHSPARAHHHGRGRSVRPAEIFRDPRLRGNPHINADRHQARRPLRVRRRPARRRRRVLGREHKSSTSPKRSPRIWRSRQFADSRTNQVGISRAVISRRAKSGPRPCSSCLKYTNTSDRSQTSNGFVPTVRCRPADTPRRAVESSRNRR